MAKTNGQVIERVPAGRLVNYSRKLDVGRRYLTDSPTAIRFKAIQQAVDAGDIAAMVEMTEEMEGKDAHLQGVANTRRGAVTALEWKVVPDPEAPPEQEGAAQEAADFVSEHLTELSTWEGTLEHLSTAIGPNVAVVELVWRGGLLVDTVDVPGHRLLGNQIGRAHV